MFYTKESLERNCGGIRSSGEAIISRLKWCGCAAALMIQTQSQAFEHHQNVLLFISNISNSSHVCVLWGTRTLWSTLSVFQCWHVLMSVLEKVYYHSFNSILCQDECSWVGVHVVSCVGSLCGRRKWREEAGRWEWKVRRRRWHVDQREA